MYVLPVASSALFFGAIQFNMSPESMTPQMKKLLPIFKILPVAFLPITVQLPALFHFFGLTSIIFQTGQTLALKNKVSLSPPPGPCFCSLLTSTPPFFAGDSQLPGF